MISSLKSLEQLLKGFARRVRNSNLYFKAIWTVDRTATRGTKPIAQSSEKQHVLLCAPGNGNIGDQAMFEAFLDRQDGEILAIVVNFSAISIPDRHKHRVAILALPGITNAGPLTRWRSMQRLNRIFSAAESFTVVGADIMDGTYNVRSSIGRFSALHLAASSNVRSTVLGFSWSENPASNAIRALRSMDQEVYLNARDPRSAKRLRALGAKNVTEVSDVVFSSERIASVAEISHLEDDSFIVLNASGLIDSRILARDYGELFAWAHNSGLTVVVLPHVVRPGANDLPVCEEIFNTYASPSDVIIVRVITPDEVRGLAGRAKYVVTGRMHLAIMALSQGTPAFTLATAGKVEGLYDLFDLSQLALQPVPGFSARVIEVLESSEDLLLRTRSASHHVSELSLKNFYNKEENASANS